uniref:mucin-16 n=1 Tax=Myodes glareolus TaxID=447135 RepID=UPI0020214B47|nr:mucin-16 [Myodes glareolus]
MGQEGLAYSAHRCRPLLTLAASLLLTCGPASTLQEPRSSGFMTTRLKTTPKTSRRMLDTSTTTVTTSALHWRSSIPSNLASLKGTRISQKTVSSMEVTSSAPHISFESVVPKDTLSTLIPKTTGKSYVSASTNTSNSTKTNTHTVSELDSTLLQDTSTTVTMVKTNIPEMISTTEHTPSLAEASFTNSVLVSRTEPMDSISYPSPHQSTKPGETYSEMSTGPPNSVIGTSQTGHFVGTSNLVSSQETQKTSSVPGMHSTVSQSYPLMEKSTLLSTSYDTPSKAKFSPLEGISSAHSWGTTVRMSSPSPVNSTSQRHSHSFTGSINSPVPVTHHSPKQGWKTTWIQSRALEQMDSTTKYDPNHTEVSTNVSLLDSWTRDMSTGNISLPKLHESTSEETSIGIPIRTPGSSLTTKSQMLANSHTGHSVLASNVKTSEDTSTFVSVKHTNSSGVHAFPHSESIAPSNNIASVTLTPMPWEKSMSTESITMPRESHSPASSSVTDRHKILSTSSLASVIKISKNLIPTDLSISSGPGISSIPSLSSSPQTSFNNAQLSSVSQMTTVSTVRKGNHEKNRNSTSQLKYTIATPISSGNEYFTIFMTKTEGTTVPSPQPISFATAEIGRQTDSTLILAWKNDSKPADTHATKEHNTSETDVLTAPSLPESQTAALFEHSTSLSMLHQSTSKDTSFGISIGFPGSITTTESEETTASHRGHSVVTSNMVTSQDTSTPASNMETQHSGTRTFPLSESRLHSVNPPFPSQTHSTWEESMSASSTRPTSEAPSHSPVAATADRHSTSSPLSVTSLFTAAKDPTPTRLYTTSGPASVSALSPNSVQLSKALQTTSVSSLTQENSMENETYTRHAKHTITPTSAPWEKESFTTIMPSMEHTRLPPSQPISSGSTEIQTGTASSPKAAQTDVGISEDRNSTIEHNPNRSELHTSPSFFESKTGALSADSAFLSAPHQSTSEDAPTGISTSLPTSTSNAESKEMTSRSMGHSPVMEDILTYPDTSSTTSVKDTHSSGMHTLPHSESIAPFNNPVSASWTGAPEEGSLSPDSLSLIPGTSLPDRHSQSPDSVASIFTVTKDLLPTASHTSSDPETTYVSNWSTISQSSSNTAHASQTLPMNKFSSITPASNVETGSSVPQFKYTIMPTSMSSENKAFPTTLPTTQESTLSPSSNDIDREKIGTQTFILLTISTPVNISEKVFSSTDFINSHSEVPYSSSHPVSRTVSVSPDSTILPMLQQFTSEDTKFTSEDMSSRVVSKLSDFSITGSEEISTSQVGDSEVTSNMGLSLETSPVSSVSDGLDSLTLVPLVTATPTFLSQSHEVQPTATFSILKRSQPADSPGYPDGPTLASSVTSIEEHSTPSPSSVISAFTPSKEAITTGLDIHDLSTSFPNWSSSAHSRSPETSQVTKFSEASSASSVKPSSSTPQSKPTASPAPVSPKTAFSTMLQHPLVGTTVSISEAAFSEAHTTSSLSQSLPQTTTLEETRIATTHDTVSSQLPPSMSTDLSISESFTAGRLSTRIPPYFSASEDITTGSILSHTTYPSRKKHIELTSILEADNSGSLLYDALSRDTATTVSVAEFSSPEPQTSPYLAMISESRGSEKQSLLKEKHISSDSTSTVTEKTTPPVTSTSQVQNDSSLDSVSAFVTSIQETTSIGKDENVHSGSTSIQGLDTTGLSIPSPSYDIRNLTAGHIPSTNQRNRIETNSPGAHTQGTVLVDSIPSRITTVMMTPQSNWHTALSTSMPISKPAHTEAQKTFPLTSIEQEITMPEDTNLMTKRSSDLFTEPTRTSTGLSRTEVNSAGRISISSSGSFTKTADISMGNTSNISTLSFPNIDHSQVINAAESSKVTALWSTSGTTADTGTLSTVTQTVLHPDSMTHASSSEPLSWTDSLVHEAISSVKSVEIPLTTSPFLSTSSSEGQGLTSSASGVPTFSSGERTRKELDSNLDSFTTPFPSWRNSELVSSKDTRTSQASYILNRTEATSVDITTPGPQFQNTVSSKTLIPDGTASSLLSLLTKTPPSSASSLARLSSSSTSFPKTSFHTSEFPKTTDTLIRSLKTGPGPGSPPNLSSTLLEILGFPEVTTDRENFHSSSKFKVTSMEAISTGPELSSSVPIRQESSRDAYTVGTSSSTWVTSMSTSLPDYLETIRSDTQQVFHVTSGLRDTSISLQTSMHSSPVSTLILPSSETAVASASLISTPYQTQSSQSTEVPEQTVLYSSSITESAGVTSLPESSFTVPSLESTHVPRTDMLPADEMTSDETTLSAAEDMASFPTTSIPKGSSLMTSNSPHSITKSSHSDVLVATTVKELPSSTSTSLPFPVSTSTDFTASPSLHKTTPSETEDSMQSLTETPNGAAHGDTPGLGKSPLASISPASPKELSTEGAVKAETTDAALKTTPIATSTTKISTISRPLTRLWTPKTTGDINTTEMIITASDASRNVLGMTASLSTGSREKPSTVLRTRPSSYSREPESTASKSPSLRTETSQDSRTLTGSSGDSGTVPWVTYPLEITSAAAKMMLSASQGESDSTVSTATIPREEVSSAIPQLTVFSTVPDLPTSLISKPEESTGMFIPTLTDSPSEPKTIASGVTHPGTEVSYSAASTFPTDTSGMAAPLDISTGAETKPAFRSLTVAPSESHTIFPRDTHLTQSRILASENILDISSGESDTTTLSVDTEVMLSVPTTTASPVRAGLATSLVVRSQTQKKNSTSTVTPAGEPESTVTLVTDPKAWGTTAILNTSNSAAVAGKIIEPTTSTLTAFPDQLFNTTSWLAQTGTEGTSNFSTVESISSTEQITTSGITHFTETNVTLPKTDLTFSHGGSDLTLSTTTSAGKEASSALPTTVTSPGVPHTMTSLATSSRAVTSTSIPSLSISFSKPETTDSFTTNAGAQIISAITVPSYSPTLPGMLASLKTSSGTKSSPSPASAVSPGQPETTIPGAKSSPTLAVFPGEPDTTISLVTSHAAISPTVLKTAPEFSQHGLDVTPSVASSLGTETNLAGSSPIFSPEVKGVLTSLAPSFSTVTNESTPAQSVSADESDTTVSLVSHRRSQVSSTIATLTVSPDVPEMMSLTTSSKLETSLFPTQIAFSSQPETTASEVSHPGDKASPKIPSGTRTPTEPDEATRPSFSHMDLDTTPPTSTIIGPETSSSVLTTTILLVVPDMVTSQVPSFGTDSKTTKPILMLHSSEPQTVVSLATNAGEESRSAISTAAVSLAVTEVMTSPVSSSGAETHAMPPIQTASPADPDTITSWVTHSGREGTSDVLTVSTLPGGTGETKSWNTHSSETNLTGLMTTPDVSHTASAGLPSMATSSETEARSDSSTSAFSSNVSEVLSSPVTTFRTVTSTNIPVLTLSSDKPETGVSMSTYTVVQKTSSLPTVTASSGIPGIVTSLVPSSEMYSSTISPQITSYSQILEKTASQVTLSKMSEDSSFVTTLTTSPDEAGTSAPFVISPEETSTKVPRTNTSFSHIEPHSTPSTVTTGEQEAGSSAPSTPTIVISSNIPDVITLEGHRSETSKPILTLQPSEPHTKMSLTFQAGEKISSPMSTTAVSPGVTEMIRPLFTSSETGSHKRNQTISSGQPETTTSWIMNPETEATARVLTTIISPNVLEILTSKSVNQTLKSQTIGSLVTHAGKEPNSTISTLAVSPDITEKTTSLVTTKGRESRATTPTLTFPPRLPNTTISWINSPEKEASSGARNTNLTSSVTDMMTLTILSHTPSEPQKKTSLATPAGQQQSLAMNSMSVSQGITEVTSQVNISDTESHAVTSNTDLSLIQPEATEAGVTDSGRQDTSGVLSSTISHSIPKMVTSPNLISAELNTTVSLVTYIGEHHSSDIATRPISPDKSEMIPSLVTGSSTDSYLVTSTLTVSLDQHVTIAPLVPHPGKEVTSKVLSTPVTPGVPDMMTSTTLIHTPPEPQTIASLVTHAGEHPNLSMSAQTVPSGVTELMTSTATTSGTETHETNPALLVFPGPTNSTALWVTHAETEDTSGVLTTPISASVPDLVTSTTPVPSESHSTVSSVTHIGEQPSSARSTLAGSPGNTKLIPSLVTSSSSIPPTTLEVSTGKPETIALWITHPGTEGSSEDLSTTISAGVTDMMTSTALVHTPSEPQTRASLVTHPGRHPNSSLSDQAVSSDATEMTRSLVTSLGTGSYVMVTRTEREGTSGVLSTTISASVPKMISTATLFPSEPVTETSFVTSAEGQTNLSLSTMAVSPSITEMTSQATTLGTETEETPPVLLVSPDERETTASRVTHIERVPTSGSPTSTISTIFPDLVTSPTLISSEPHTTVSFITLAEEQQTTQTVSPGITEMIPSMITLSGKNNHSASSTLADSVGEAETTTHTGNEDTSVVLTTAISLSGLDTMTSTIPNHTTETQNITSLVPHAGGQPSLSMSTQSVSPGITEVTPSLFTNLGTSSAMTTTVTVSPGQPESTVPWVPHPGIEGTSRVLSMTISPNVPEMMSSPTLIPSESHTIVSLVTHFEEQSSSTMSAKSVAPGITEMIPSQVTSSGTKNHPITSSLSVSSGQTESTAPWVTHPGKEDTSGVLTSTISPHVPGTLTLTAVTHITSEPQTGTLVTHAGGQPSTSMSTLAISPHVTEMIPSLGTSSGVPEMMTSPNLISSEADTTISLVTDVGGQPSSTMSTKSISPRVTETISSLITSSYIEMDSVSSTLATSPGQQETPTSLLTTPITEAPLSILRTPISPSVPDMLSSSTLIPSEPHTTMSLTSHVEGQPSSAMPIRPVPPEMITPTTLIPSESHNTISGVTEMMTSLATTSETKTYTATPVLTVSSSQTENTASSVLLPGKEATSTISTLSTLPGEPKGTETWLILSAKPSTPLSTATLKFSSSEPDITPSASGAETTSGIPTTLSSGVPYMTTPLTAGSTTDNSKIFLTLSTLMHEPTSAVSLVSHSALIQQTSSASDSGLDVTPSIINHPGTETSSSVPTMTLFPGAPGVEISQFSSSGPSTSTFPNTVLSPSEPKSTVSLPTFLSTETNPTFPVSTGFLPSLETTASEPITSKVDVSTTLLTQTVSPSVPEMTNFLLNSSVTEESKGDLGTTFSSGASEETASLPTHSGTETSTIILSVTPSPILTGTTGLWASITTAESTLTMSPSVSGFPGVPTTSKSSSETLQSIATSASVTTVRLSDLVTDATSPIITLIPSESSTSPITDLETSDTSHLATTSSRPNGNKTTTTQHGLSTSTMSTWFSENVTSRPTTSIYPELVPFTFNLTITNLPYTTEMGYPDSLHFKKTEKALNYLFQSLFKNTSIGSSYSGCMVSLIRSEQNGAATGVDSICTYHHDPMSPPLDRKQLYQEVTQLTNGITRLGPYILDRDSLYVNGYNRRYWTPPTNSTRPSLELFTLNFTITNLHHTEGMRYQGSEIFNSTERILNRLLKPLFKNTSIGSLYSGCRLILLRPERERTATGVDAVCTYHSDPMGHKLDREKLYWELSHNTQGVTKLGSFTLEKDSLYINDFTHRTSAPTSSTPVTLSLSFTGTSTAQPYLSTVATPVFAQFTLNFTITNLAFKEYMLYHGSKNFNTLERVLQYLLKSLFKTSSLGSLYAGCTLVSLRSKKDGTATRVDAICTYHPDIKGHRLDREQLYWELNGLTHGVTRLDPYTLERDSLYVNGFTHLSSALISSTMTHSLVPFTLNFTITNLQYTPAMEHPGSLKFNKTEKVLQYLLAAVFKNTTIGPLYSGCQLILLTPEKDGSATGVNMICTHRSEPTDMGLDPKQLYWELSRETHGITQLDFITLDKNSLYVNGYNHWLLTSNTSMPGSPLVPFTINFTITNLEYEEGMRQPGSWKFNATERILRRLLWSLFNRTSISLLYSDCRLILLRSENDGAATGVDAICTHHPDPTESELDNEQVYEELRELTNNITQLGPYTLDQNSLYINGYTHQSLSIIPITAAPVLVHFTINFTITNLAFEEDMSRPGSRKFNITERILQSLLRPLFQKSSVGPVYAGCVLASLRSENDGIGTGVDAVCTHHLDPTGQGMDRKKVYWELSRLTYGVSRLGHYTLDQNSLYVDGYTHQNLATTTKISVMTTASTALTTSFPSHTAGPVPVPFTINFTITNLEFVDDMSHPGSGKFNVTERILQRLFGALFSKTSVGPLYSGCRLALLRPENNGTAIGVDAICTYQPNTSNEGLDRKRLYWELRRLNKGIMKLGPYTLDKNSLYVNGYTQQTLATTHRTLVMATVSEGMPNTSSAPTAAGPVLVPFSINFTIINLEFEEEMGHPGSRKFNILDRTLQSLFRPLFSKISAGPLYSGCRLTLLRPEKNGNATGVDATCTHHLDPAGHRLENEQIYGELSSLTQGVTQLGPYILDKNSLYVNGYTHQILATTPRTSSSPPLLCTLNFTITNLPYTEDMWGPGYAKFNKVEKVLQLLLKPLFQNTSVGLLYSGCRLTSLSPRKNGEATGVDTVCAYHPDHTGHGLAREQLYLELSKLTSGVTQLGPYTLEWDSLYVNGYTNPTSGTILNTPVTTTSFPASSLAPFSTTNSTGISTIMVPVTLNFTITNLHYTEEMGHPGSLKFNSTKWILHYLLDTLLNKTIIATHYSGCRLASLRSDNHRGATAVDIICTFLSDSMSPGFVRDQLFWELSHETHGITRLGPYTLDQNSLYINGYHFGTATPANTTGEVGEEMFTVNFTINNLRYSADMGQIGSPKFNITDTLMQHLLSPLFQRSSLGPLYTGCKVVTLRSVKNGAQTQVDVLCTYRQVPNSLGLPAKPIFYDLSWQTRGITRLGPYSLDKDSLYINGYNEPGPDVPPTTPEPATTILPSPSTSLQPESNTDMRHHLETFTINFTISNLPYSPDMISGSALFNSTEHVLQNLLGSLFQNSSFNSSCRLTSLRPAKNGTFTGVATTCTYQHNPAHPGMDVQDLYSKLSHLSHGVTQLGNYTLEKHSLYVNGYNEPGSDILTTAPEPSTTILPFTLTSVQPESTTAVEHHLKTVILNFTISNLPYSEDMNYSSAKFNSTESVLQFLLTPLFQNISFNASCRLTSLRPEKNQNYTSVMVICSYQHDSVHPGLQIQEIYSEMSHLTHGVTQLGNYTLDKDSLYVNGYSGTGTEESTTNPKSATTMPPSPTIPVQTETTTAVGHHLKTVSVSFTISNLPYSANMNNGSAVFNSTEIFLKNLMEPLLHNGSFNSSCRLDSLRPEKNGTATGVEVICTYLHDLAHPMLDTHGFYSELSNLTHGITQLGNYTLDKGSLHVNGYNKPGPEEPPTTPEPATTTLPSPSASLQPEPATGVDAICAYYQDPAHPGLDIKELYTELRNLTQELTQLGNYSLDKDSLYVNGYNKPRPEEPSTTYEPVTTTLPSPSASLQPEPATAIGHHLETLTINFTITNLPYSSNMSNGSVLFNKTETFLQYLLGHVFQNGSLNSSCRLDSLRPKKNGTVTGVDVICAYYQNPAHPGMDIKELYTELRNLTQGITQLGNYSLDKDSLYLNGYSEHDAEGLPTTTESPTTILASPSTSVQPEPITDMKPTTLLPTEIPTTSTSSQHFNLNFTITNLPYSQDIAQPGTTKHQQNKRSIEYALNQLFRNSSIKSYFSDCQVLAFRSVSNSNHTGVDSLCNFSPLARRVDRIAIYEEFLRMTQNGTQLLNFTLDRKSVVVDGYSSNRDDNVIKNSGLPFWAIILICLAVLLIFITCLICCFLVSVCRRKKEGDYQVQRHRLGYYLPHLDLRKLP